MKTCSICGQKMEQTRVVSNGTTLVRICNHPECVALMEILGYTK